MEEDLPCPPLDVEVLKAQGMADSTYNTPRSPCMIQAWVWSQAPSAPGGIQPCPKPWWVGTARQVLIPQAMLWLWV